MEGSSNVLLNASNNIGEGDKNVLVDSNQNMVIGKGNMVKSSSNNFIMGARNIIYRWACKTVDICIDNDEVLLAFYDKYWKIKNIAKLGIFEYSAIISFALGYFLKNIQNFSG